jgi:hypothetical protein
VLNPRIYRAAFVPVVFAVVVAAFSLTERAGPITTTLAPDAFDGAAAYRTMSSLAQAYPRRAPGSAADQAIAGRVASALRANHFGISIRTISGQTARGSRTITTVIGERVGFSARRIIVVAHRDARGAPARAALSGTAVLMELARVLGGRTLGRSLVLASTSGSAGALGAGQLAHSPGGPVDAVIVLGDLASRTLRPPFVVPWGDGPAVASERLRRTVEAAIRIETGRRPGGFHLLTQFSRLAFPLTLGEQGPFVGTGSSAVLVGASGERGPAPGAATSAANLAGFGRAIVRSVTALDGGPVVGRSSAYLEIQDKRLDSWPLRLLVGTLLLPALAALIDGFARVRRRREPVLLWLRWLVATIAPFALAALFVLALRAVGLIDAAPGHPVTGREVPRDGSADGILASVALVLALGWIGLRPLLLRLLAVRGDPASPGAAAATLLVLCAATIAVWVLNPYAALLLVPALHLWLVLGAPELRMRLRVALPLVALGFAPAILVALSYATQFGIGPLDLAWTGVLAVAGGQIGIAAALGWSVVLGCSAAAIAIAVRASRTRPPESAPVTVRGPVGYAGPGSLGGTESALRR